MMKADHTDNPAAATHDQRVRFVEYRDALRRNRTSDVLQFYSSVDNIGNYTPVLGIQRMLGFAPDTACVHDRTVDFDVINKRYRCVIVGGAGLMHRVFDPFWRRLLDGCRLPMVIWGVGLCLPHTGPAVAADRAVVREVAARCDLVNVRDRLTAAHYGLASAHVSLCPTVHWLRDFIERGQVDQSSRRVLFSSHEQLVPHDATAAIAARIQSVVGDFDYTSNVQTPAHGLSPTIEQYRRSRLVVTTRLHGAIIAYGLGVPYLALSWDRKLEAFCDEHGHGRLLGSPRELAEALVRDWPTPRPPDPAALKNVAGFGEQVRDWLDAVGCNAATDGSANVTKGVHEAG
jgi:hypothetical protein